MTGPVGPPRVTDLTISAFRIGARPDCHATSEITFGFDQPVVGWRVRVNSRTAFDGTEAARWERRFVGFGRQAFGTSTFGRGSGDPPALSGAATLTAADLRVGDNDVAIYGRSVRGFWSH